MPNLATLSDLVKKPMFFVTMMGAFIIVVLISSYVTSFKETPMWKGLKPEVSTRTDVIKSLGEPKKQQDSKKFKILGYKSEFENRLHEVWLEGDKVVLIKEQVNPEDKRNTKDFKNLSGTVVKLYSENFADAQVLNFYEEKGVALLRNKNTSLVNEIWYFQPVQAGNFVSRFDTKLSIFEPVRFN